MDLTIFFSPIAESIFDTATVRMACSDLGDYTDEKMYLYPNPAEDVMNLFIPGDYTAIVTISDMMGKTIKSFKQISGLSQINISDLASGIYFIRIEGQTPDVQKFIKQ